MAKRRLPFTPMRFFVRSNEYMLCVERAPMTADEQYEVNRYPVDAF